MVKLVLVDSDSDGVAKQRAHRQPPKNPSTDVYRPDNQFLQQNRETT